MENREELTLLYFPLIIFNVLIVKIFSMSIISIVLQHIIKMY
jgi:hypothetical protein